MSVTDRDRERAAQVVQSLSPEDAYVDESIYDGEVAPLTTAIAQALAEERERTRAPFLRMAASMEASPHTETDWRTMADRIRAAAEDRP